MKYNRDWHRVLCLIWAWSCIHYERVPVFCCEAFVVLQQQRLRAEQTCVLVDGNPLVHFISCFPFSLRTNESYFSDGFKLASSVALAAMSAMIMVMHRQSNKRSFTKRLLQIQWNPDFSNPHFSNLPITLTKVVPSPQSNTVLLPPISRTLRFLEPICVSPGGSRNWDSTVWQLVAFRRVSQSSRVIKSDFLIPHLLLFFLFFL